MLGSEAGVKGEVHSDTAEGAEPSKNSASPLDLPHTLPSADFLLRSWVELDVFSINTPRDTVTPCPTVRRSQRRPLMTVIITKPKQ